MYVLLPLLADELLVRVWLVRLLYVLNTSNGGSETQLELILMSTCAMLCKSVTGKACLPLHRHSLLIYK